jgi:hypothetical protein
VIAGAARQCLILDFDRTNAVLVPQRREPHTSRQHS